MGRLSFHPAFNSLERKADEEVWLSQSDEARYYIFFNLDALGFCFLMSWDLDTTQGECLEKKVFVGFFPNSISNFESDKRE